MALDINELQRLLDSAQSADTERNELRKAVTKHIAATKKLTDTLNELNAELLERFTNLGNGAATAKTRKPRAERAPKELGEVDPEAPYGRKKDGSPKGRPGRAKTE